jgi:hypothetical protein
MSEELVLESIFYKCFKPVMSGFIEKIKKAKGPYRSDKIAISKIYEPIISDYDSFVTSGVDKESWKDLVNTISKNYVTKNSKAFMKTIPDFYSMITGVKGKAGTEEYDKVLRAIGMSEIGKLREPFEHIRSLTALMKGVTTSGILELLDDQNKKVKEIKTPDQVRSEIKGLLVKAKTNDSAAAAIVNDKNLRTALASVGVKGFADILDMDVEKVISDLDQEDYFDKIASKSSIDIDDPDIQEHVLAVVNKFIRVVEEHFTKIAKGESPADLKLIYEFIGNFAFDVKGAQDSIAAGQAANVIQDFVEFETEDSKKSRKK